MSRSKTNLAYNRLCHYRRCAIASARTNFIPFTYGFDHEGIIEQSFKDGAGIEECLARLSRQEAAA